MADLGVLARLPGLAGYLAGQQNDQAMQMGQLQQVGALQGIVAGQQAQQAKNAAMAKEAAFRSALAGADTPEKQAAVAAQFGDSKDILAHADRVASAANTKELALARLQQTAITGRQMFELRMKSATTAADKAAVDAEYKQWVAGVQRERLKYDTGADVPTFQLPQTAGGAPEPSAQPSMPVSAPTDAERAAMAQLRPLAQGGGSVEVQPTPAPSAAPVAPEPVAAPIAPAAPNNLDARDLGARSRGPVMGTTPTPVVAAPVAVAPAKPVMPEMPPEIARLPQKARDAWTLQQGKASIAGAGRLSPEALTDVAAQYLAGDRQAISGFARDQATKSAIQNEISKQMRDKGWKGPDVAAQMADFAGIMSGSRTVGTRAAQIELASSEADKMIDIARERSKAFERTQFVPVNVAIKAYETNTGEPEVKAFGAAVNSLVNVYARAISPSGVPTVSDKDHAREMLSTVDSPAQFQAVTDVMRQEMKAAREAPGEVRRATRAAVTGATPATPSGFDADKEKRYQEWKARQPK